jgi:hypothetical protein
VAMVAAPQELRVGDKSHLLACAVEFDCGAGVDAGEYLFGAGRYVVSHPTPLMGANRCVGQYSVTAKVTVVVTAACSTVAAALFLLYNTVMLKLVKRRHEREMRDVEDEERVDVEALESARGV